MPDGTLNQPAGQTPGVTAEGWLTDSWYFACASRSLEPGKQFRRMILGQPVLLARTPAKDGKSGEAFALRDVCPHRLVPLSAGKQVETDGKPTIQCPYHGWRYGTDGVCALMPSLVDPKDYPTDKVKVRRYPVHEINGMVFVYVADNPRSEDPPAVAPPDFGLGNAKPKFFVVDTFNAHMDDAVVGLMDPAHVPFVHNQWWWRPPSTGLRLKEKPFEPRTRGWAIAPHEPSSNSIAYKLLGARPTTEIIFQIPGFRWEIVTAGRHKVVTITCLTPQTQKRTRITQITYWWNTALADLLLPFLIPMARKFLGQDGHMVNLQNRGMAYQKGPGLWIDDIDVQAKWYLTLKKEWAASRAEKRDFANPIQPRTLRWRS